MNPSPILDRRVLDDLLDGSLDEKLERARSPVELYGAKTGNCLRVSVALEEAEIPYIVRKLDHGRANTERLNISRGIPSESYQRLSSASATVAHSYCRNPTRFSCTRRKEARRDFFRQIPLNERSLCNVSSISSPTSSRSAMRVSRPRTMEAISHSWTDDRSGLWLSPNRSWKIRPSWPVRLLAEPTSQPSR